MSSKQCVPTDTIVEQIDSFTVDKNGSHYGVQTGMSVFLQSAFSRMTLVGTSTIVAVTSIAFLTIGTCELTNSDGTPNGNEALVLVVGGGILLIASFFQFISVGMWSGWCSMWPTARSNYEREIHLLPPNQFLINGQMVKGTQSENTYVSCPAFELHEPNLQMIPEETDDFSRTISMRSDRHHEIIPMLEIMDKNIGIKVDATTSTRGEIVYFPMRGVYAPLALQEEITPSLRSSFQSFDELAN